MKIKVTKTYDELFFFCSSDVRLQRLVQVIDYNKEADDSLIVSQFYRSQM